MNRLKTKTRKGIQLNQAFGAVLALILVAVLVILAIVIFDSLNNSLAASKSEAITNESVTPDGPTEVFLAGSGNCSAGNFAITLAVNGSVGIDSANFTLDTTTGALVNTTDEFIDTPWNVSYTYTWGSESCEAGEILIVQFATYPALVGLVGTIIFLGIVIGVLVSAFVIGRKEGP